MEALALVELDSIAAGYRAADELVKHARVDLVESRPLDPGKFLVLFRGDVASVEAAFGRAVDVASGHVVDRVFLPAVHRSIGPLLAGEEPKRAIDALGVIETTTVASIVRAADRAAKAAPVRLLRLHLARRIGGKGYLVLTGTLADAEAAVAAGCGGAREEGTLAGEVVIAAPAEETFRKITERWL